MLEAPALRAEEERLRHVQCQRQRPHQALRPAVEGGRRNDEADADRGSSARPSTDWRKSGIVAARDQEQTDLGEADDAVRAREQQRVVPERARHTECDDQESSHRHEHHETDAALLRVEHARQPGVPDPRPPQDAEDEQAPREPHQVGSSAISAVHCVIARTKTRSKKSPSGVTRSVSRNTAEIRGARDEPVLTP